MQARKYTIWIAPRVDAELTQARVCGHWVNVQTGRTSKGLRARTRVQSCSRNLSPHSARSRQGHQRCAPTASRGSCAQAGAGSQTWTMLWEKWSAYREATNAKRPLDAVSELSGNDTAGVAQRGIDQQMSRPAGCGELVRDNCQDSRPRPENWQRGIRAD